MGRAVDAKGSSIWAGLVSLHRGFTSELVSSVPHQVDAAPVGQPRAYVHKTRRIQRELAICARVSRPVPCARVTGLAYLFPLRARDGPGLSLSPAREVTGLAYLLLLRARDRPGLSLCPARA